MKVSWIDNFPIRITEKIISKEKNMEICNDNQDTVIRFD